MSLLVILLFQVGFRHEASLLLGGEFCSGVADDSLLYVADGRGISVFTQKGFNRLGGARLSGRTSGITRWQDVFFVAGTRGLAALDAAACLEPDPQVRWLHEEAICALAVSDGKLWFADETPRLYSLDLKKNPAAPELAVELPVRPVRIIPHGEVVYLAADTMGLYVFDPTAKKPTVKKVSLRGSPPVMDVLFNDDLVYLACAERGLWVAEPGRGAFKVAAEVAADGELYRLALFDDRLVAAAGTANFLLFSLENPAEPIQIQQQSFPGTSVDLAARGKLCFLFTRIGLGRMDLTSRPLAGRGYTYRASSSGYDVLTRAGIAVIAAGKGGLRAVKLSDTLSFIGAFLDIYDARRVYLFGSEVYVLNATNRLEVLDLKDPMHPRRRGMVQFKAPVGGIDAFGGMLLAAEQEQGVGTWWRCPCGPFKEQGRLGLGGRAMDVVLDKKTAFVSTDLPRLHVIDWTDSTQIEEIAYIDLKRSYERLYLDAEHLFALDESGALGIFSVARPTRPKKLAVLELPGAPRALARDGGMLFVAADSGGVHVVDISKIGSPKLVETIDLDRALGVAVSEDKLLVSTRYALEVYRIQPSGS